MTKASLSIITISLGLMAGIAMADDSGSIPGYVYTPTSGSTVVKTAYGQCLHNAYWEPAYGLDECGEAPEAPPQPPEPAPVPKIVVETITLSDADTVLFDFNKPILTVAAQQKLTAFANKFKESGDVTKITVDGYTDAIGTDEYNKKLSTDRAQTIKNFFASNGFSPDVIVAEGMGEQDSKVSAGCIRQFGDGHLAEIDRLNSKLKKTKSAKAKKQIKAQLAKLESSRDKLIACAAPDRRVVLLVEHTGQVKKQIMVMPAAGKVSPETTIKDSSAPEPE